MVASSIVFLNIREELHVAFAPASTTVITMVQLHPSFDSFFDSTSLRQLITGFWEKNEITTLAVSEFFKVENSKFSNFFTNSYSNIYSNPEFSLSDRVQILAQTIFGPNWAQRLNLILYK